MLTFLWCSHCKSPFLLSDYFLKKLCDIVLMRPSGLSFKATVHLDFNWCLPFSFENFLDVELQNLAEWFMISKQRRQNIILSELQHMYQNAGMGRTEWTWNIQTNTSEPHGILPLPDCVVCKLDVFVPLWKCDALEY